MSYSKPGKLIVFSGLDGAGKSTQIKLLSEELGSQGEYPICLWTRGGYTKLMEKSKAFARLIFRRQLPPPGHSPKRTHSLKKQWIRRLWLTLAIFDLMRVYGIQVRWWRWQKKIVICDRYIWDTLIDFRMNFPADNIEKWLLWKILVWITPCPTRSFLMLVPIEESMKRSQDKGEPFPDSRVVLEDRLTHYTLLSKNGHWHILDGREPQEKLAETIWNSMQNKQESQCE